MGEKGGGERAGRTGFTGFSKRGERINRFFPHVCFYKASSDAFFRCLGRFSFFVGEIFVYKHFYII